MKRSLTDFFSFQPGPAPAPAAGTPDAIFPTNAERVHKKSARWGNTTRTIYVSYAQRDGTLMAGCECCTRVTWADISRFAPKADSHITAGKRQQFDAAYAEYTAAYLAGDKDNAITQRAIVENLRSQRCDNCATEQGYCGPAAQACKDEYLRMKYDACVRNDGCANPDCTERGMASWPVLQADHGTNPKVEILSRYKEWPSLGGVRAMRAEEQQIHQWICGVCHNLEPTSNTGNRCPNPATMPNGKRSGTADEQIAYHAKRYARIVFPKQWYVDAKKRAIGACQYPDCGRKVLPGTEAGFDFDHVIESTKCKGGLYGKQGGVSGLVANVAKEATLAKVQDLLDAEMDKCNLLCTCCHKSRKLKGLGRHDVPPEPPQRAEL